MTILQGALRSLFGSPLRAGLTGVVVAGASFLLIASTTEVRTLERKILEGLNGADVRTITIRDANGGPSMTARDVLRLSQLQAVEVVCAMGPASAVTLQSPLSHALSFRHVQRECLQLDVIQLGAARIAGSAVEKYGPGVLITPIQVPTGELLSVGGIFEPGQTSLDLNADVVMPVAELEEIRIVILRTSSIADVEAVAALSSNVGPSLRDESVSVAFSADFIRRGAVLRGDLQSRLSEVSAIITIVLSAIVSLVFLLGAKSRSAELGLRRVFGASRTNLSSLIALENLIVVLVGLSVGTAVASAFVRIRIQAWPAVSDVLDLYLVSVSLGLVVSVLPAVVVLTLDPLEVLRLP